MTQKNYDYNAIEQKWQKEWYQNKIQEVEKKHGKKPLYNNTI